MKVLSKQEATLWCKAHHIALSYRGLPERSDANLKFEIPCETQKTVYLVSQVMKSFEDEPSLLVWFHDWSVWPSSQQRMHVFDRFRMSYGETRPLIESPAHLFDQTEIEDATSFVTFAALFLWDCYVTNPGRSKLLYFSHDEYGLTKGIELPRGVKVRSVAKDMVWPCILPIWSTDYREVPAGDPIGCPVSVGEMVKYVYPLFNIRPGNLEFIQKGQIEESSYWLWAFHGDDGRRVNICVFSGPDPPGAPMRTWMSADNNPHDLNDRDYVVAIHNRVY